jgi:hypothetical protein
LDARELLAQVLELLRYLTVSSPHIEMHALLDGISGDPMRVQRQHSHIDFLLLWHMLLLAFM